MIFLFVMPMTVDLANYIVPLQLGAAYMAFPRINSFSFWMRVAGAILIVSAFAFGGSPTGWTLYVPLSAIEPYTGIDLLLMGLVAAWLMFTEPRGLQDLFGHWDVAPLVAIPGNGPAHRQGSPFFPGPALLLPDPLVAGLRQLVQPVGGQMMAAGDLASGPRRCSWGWQVCCSSQLVMRWGACTPSFACCEAGVWFLSLSA